ncbi:MAG: LEA type 2 family protein [Archangium sp.]|nr:LEA type 2 family protein [Archangium sp.]
MKRSMLSLLMVLAACKTAPEVVADVVEPTLPQEEFVIVTQSLTQVDIKYTGTVIAGGEPITVEKAAWEFVVDGTVKRSGEDKLNLSAAAGQNLAFELDESLTYVKDEEELKAMDARGGSLLLAMRGTLFVTIVVPASGDQPAGKRTVELPFAKSKEVKTPRLPHLKLIDFEAGRFSENEVQAVFHVGVVNPNNFQISITGLDYTAQLAGKEVSKGTIGAGDRVSAASTGVFDITATMNEETHAKEAAKIVKGSVIPYLLKSSLRAQLYSEELESKGHFKLKASK